MSYDGTITTTQPDPNLVETFTHEDGSKTFIVLDTDPELSNPRDFENAGTMVTPHRRYTLGDESTSGEIPGYSEALRAMEHYANRPKAVEHVVRYLRIFVGATVVLPVGLIDHSGLSMYASAGPHWSDPGGWDSGTIGFIFDTPKGRELAGFTTDETEGITEVLRGEVSVYDQYLRGEVYGFHHVMPDGTEEDVWGLLGYDSLANIAREATDSPITEGE